jgi:hypothetical protein
LLDVHTQCVVGPSNPSEEDIKEGGYQEEEDATAAMLVTVEEDNGTMIKRSQITEKQLTAIMSNNLATKAEARRNNHDSGFDLSLHNHMSIRELSPSPSNGETENNLPGRTNSNLSLSPSRFASARLVNSEISDTQNMVKRLSLHTYHIRNKNGNPTAQVAIMKDTEET